MAKRRGRATRRTTTNNRRRTTGGSGTAARRPTSSRRNRRSSGNAAGGSGGTGGRNRSGSGQANGRGGTTSGAGSRLNGSGRRASGSAGRSGGGSFFSRGSRGGSGSGTGRQTVGGLIPAKIYAIDSKENAISNNFSVHCAFNPSKYSISVSSSFNVKGLNPFTMNYNIEADTKNEKPRELKLQELWFDAYENNIQDVRPVTETLMDLAQLRDTSAAKKGNKLQKLLAALKPQPAKIMFEWGAFKFRGLIKSLNIDYVMFTENGTPVRAKASITLVEYRHRNAYPRQNPTSGGGPTEQIWVVRGQERLDTIAANVYGDATLWRHIATHNNIEDPNGLRPGQELAIPAV